MSNRALRAAEDYLLPVYEELHWQLVKREALHADGCQGCHKLPENIRVVGCRLMPGGSSMRHSTPCRRINGRARRRSPERFKKRSPEERRKQRLKEEKTILDALLAWADGRCQRGWRPPP